MVITPDGNFSTAPDDYIFAMKRPQSILENAFRMLSQSPQAAPLMSGAVNSVTRQGNNYNNSNAVYNETKSISAPVNITIQGSGLPPDQIQSLVQRGVQDALESAISSSRSSIPSPEKRKA
ncbi:hypothetical protein FACS1894172_14810 [Spirochaetia bacterium]|nr:hypothetical protein FACS1894172_14810 [Spirochaetia bacterium]